jgi:hypothetical protein
MVQVLNKQAQVRLAVQHMLVALLHATHGFLMKTAKRGRGGKRKEKNTNTKHQYRRHNMTYGGKVSDECGEMPSVPLDQLDT